MNYQFGSGKAFTTDTSGNIIEIANLTDVELDFNVTTKKLPGAYRYALAIGDSEGDIKVTAKNTHFSAAAFNIVWGGTLTTGAGQAFTPDEIGTVATASYTVANAAAYVALSAVVWLTPPGGAITRQLKRVSSGPVAGVSFVDAGSGVLNFNAADNGGTVRVTYRTTVTSGAQQVAIGNPLVNSSMGVKLSLFNQSLNRQNGKMSQVIVDLNNCILPSLKLGFKSSDWTQPDYSIEVAADANNQIGTAYFVNFDS